MSLRRVVGVTMGFLARVKPWKPYSLLGTWALGAMLLLGAVGANAQTADQPTGAGTVGDPYQIATLNHLYWLSSNAPSFSTFTYLIQTADIDASATTNWFEGKGWPPIDCQNFLKLYDGQGHTIRGLRINSEEIQKVGFLGHARGAEFRNLGLVDLNVTMGDAFEAEAVGGFAGVCDNTILLNCYATGVVTGIKGVFAGGLIGQAINGSLIERCSFSGQVTFPELNNDLMDGVGGLVGDLYKSTIRYSYAIGVVGNGGNAGFKMGGLVGRSSLAMTSGQNVVSDCYCAMEMRVWNWMNEQYLGAFFGQRDSTTVTNCYVDRELNGDVDLVGFVGSPVGIKGTNTAAMKTQSTYVGWLFEGVGSVWGISAGTNDGYPYLKEPSTAVAPTLTTAAITNIGTTTASGGGNITDLGGEDASQHGLCWSTSTGPTTAGSKTTLGAASATGNFNSSLSSLSYGTKYYVRAYTVNSAGTGYGNEVEFTTMSRTEAVAAAKAALEIGYAAGDDADNVTQDVMLPLTGEYDCSVSWVSGDPTVVLIEGGGGPSSVFRPLSSDGDATVQLTATIASGGSSDTRVFTVTVKSEAITLSEDMVETIMPGNLHVDGNKRLTLVGRKFRAYVNKSALSFSVSKGGWSGAIEDADIRVVSDALMAITVPFDPVDPLGSYTLHLNHDTLQDLTFNDAFEVTDDPADRVQTIQEIILSTTNPDVEVQTLSIKGAFDEELPGLYTISGEGQTVLFNNYLMLEVEGDDLTVDTRAGRKRISGTGRFTVNAEDSSGNVSGAVLYDGAFEMEEFDMEFVFSDEPTLTDYLGLSMEIGPKSMVFTQDGDDIGLSMQGIMNAGFNFAGRVGAEVNVDEVLVSLEGFDLVANLGVEANFEIGGFDSPRLALGIDTVTPEYAFGCGATIKKISEKYGFDLDFTIRKGKLQSIAILIRTEIEMPQYGTKITAFGGGIENLADQSKAPFTVRARGQISDMVAPEVLGNNFLNADLTLGVSAYHFDATGEADIYGLLDVGSAKMVVIWDASGHPRYSQRGFQLDGQVDVLGAIMGDLLVNYWENQGFFGEYNAKIQIPGYVPLVGGTTLSEERFYSDQYVATAPVRICGIPTIVTYQYKDSSIEFDVKGFPLVKQIGKALVNFGQTLYDIGNQVAEVMSRSISAAADALMRGDLGEAATELAKGVVDSARVAAEQTAVAMAQLAEETAKAIADAAAAVADAIVDVAEEVGDFFSDLFCEEGRNALSKHVGSQMTALIEVRGMVSSDLVIQAPDYYTTYLTNKPAATRFFRADSGYPIAHPTSTSTVTLVDYNPATGEGNMLYRPDSGKAYVVLDLNQVGYWNFIDWNWINAYTNAAERSNVTSYAAVKIYKLTPGCTLDYVVKNLLVTNAPCSVLDLTDAVAQSGANRFLLSIPSDSAKVSLYRPAGGAYPLQLDRNQPDWNALYVKEAGKFYAVIEPGDELAGWHIEADGRSGARAISITNDTLSMMRSLANSGLRTDFRLTPAHVASGKAMIALRHATEGCALYCPDGTQLPLVFSGPGRNADYQENSEMVYVLAEVTGASTGLWNVVDAAVVTPHVLALDVASTLDSMLAMIAASPDVAVSRVMLEDAGPWLLRATGVSRTNGIVVRDPSGQPVHPPMLVTNQYGTSVLYVRVDTTADTVGEWVFSSSNTVPLRAHWIAEPLLTLPELAVRYQAGRPYSFALGLTTIGRRVFEVALVVPAARQAGFDLASIRDDIVVYRPDGSTVPLEFSEASTNWNAYYHAATSNLYLMADVLDVGWWHVNVPYGRECTTWFVTGDPAQTLSDFKDVAAGLGSSRASLNLPKTGYYLLEIRGGDASTRIFKPDAVQAMLYSEVTQTVENARQVGDRLFVLVQSDGVPDAWRIESDEAFTFSAAYCVQDVPGLLRISDALDSAVTTELELPTNTRWAVNVRSLGSLAAAQSVTLQQPDGTNVVFEFLPPEGASHVEDYPSANARYETNRTDLILSIDATQGGTWRLTTPGRQAFEMYQLGYLPSVKMFEFAPVAGGDENTYDVTWNVDHPAPGTVVSVFLTSEADVLAGQLLGRELASGLNAFGTARVQVPTGLLPGRYYFVLAVRSASLGTLMEAAGEAIAVSYADTPAAPVNLRLDSTANAEVRVLFDDVNYSGVNRYVVMTHLVRSNEAASSVGAMRFSGGTMTQPPDAGQGNGVGQPILLAGLETGRTNLIAVCAVVGEDEASQFSPPSDMLEVYLPEPDRPGLSLSVTVSNGYQAAAGFYTNFFLRHEVVTNQHGLPVTLPGTNTYETVARTNAVLERLTLVNAARATLTISVTNGQACTFEAFLDDVSIGSSNTPATQAIFALSGLTEGDHVLEVVAINGNGDRRTDSQRLLVDLTAPYLELFSPLSGEVIYTTNVTLVGQTEMGTTLLINSNDVTGTITMEGRFTHAVSGLATNALHSFVLQSRDAAGNVATRNFMVYVATVDTNLYPANNASLVGLSIDNGSMTQEFSSATTNGYVIAATSGRIRLSPTAFSPGATVRISVNGGAFEEVNLLDGAGVVLVPGANTLVVRVVSQDGTTQRDYTFTAEGVAEFTVTPGVSGPGGIVLPSTPQTVFSNEVARFEVFADTGYIRNASVGGTAPAGSWSNHVWSTGPITGDSTVLFSFKGGVIALETNALAFAATYAGANPANQVVGMTNPGAGSFSYTNVIAYSDGAAGWLSVQSPTGAVMSSGATLLTNAVDISSVNVGTHAATVTVSAADATNVPQSYVVQLVVAQAPQGIDFPNPGEQLTTNRTALSAMSTSGLAVAFAVLSGPATLSGLTNLIYSSDGTVEIVASQSGNSNWLAAASVTQSFVVAKTSPTLIFTPSSPQTFDSTNVLTVTGSFGTGVLSYAVTAGVGEIVGTNGLHALTGTGSVTVVATKATDDMYLSAAATATVMYAKAYGSVFLQDLAQTYDGTARRITATTLPAGLTVEFTYDGNAWAPTNAGVYAVTGTLTDSDYQATTNGSMVVEKAMALVTLTNLFHVGDGIPKHAQAVTVPAGLMVDFTYNGSATAPTNPSVYAVTGTVNEANYQGETNGFLTIVHAPASLGDTVWLDANWDGVQNTGESGIPNVRMELLTNGTLMGETHTDVKGVYLFADLLPGEYTVRVDTNTLEGSLSENLTYDPDSATNHQSTVVLNAGESIRTLDFGYNWSLTNAVQGAIGDRVWVDANRNGMQDAGEPGLVGVSLSLYIDANANGAFTTQVASATTDASGKYIFPALNAGAYVVRVDTNTLPAGFTQTGDPDYFGVVLPVDRRDHRTTAPVLLAPGGVFVNADFGYAFAQGSSIGGLIYLDLNASGIWAADKPGLLGVTVVLLDAASNAVASTMTDADGTYRFTGLPAGTFTVWVSDSENVLNRRTQTGGPGGILSRSSAVVADGSSSILDHHFGFAPERHTPGLGLIGNTIFLDRGADGGAPLQGEGIQNVTVDLFDSTGTNRVATTTTDAEGHYYFGGLAAATFEVAVDTATLPFGAAGWSNTVSPVSPVVLGAGEINLDQNFGYVGLSGNIIEGVLWRDNNANGLLDEDEPDRFENVKVILRMTNGTVMSFMFTGADGAYQFTDLPDGVYGIDVLDVNNVMFGYLSSPISNPTRRRGQAINFASIFVTGGMTYTTGNVGFYLPYAELGNTVWYDINGNGLQDGGEPGLAGVQVSLTIEYPDGGAPVDVQTQTGANGQYRFSNLLLDPRYDETTTNDPATDNLPRFTVWMDTNQAVLVAGSYTPTLIDAGVGTNDSRNPAGVFVAPLRKGGYPVNYDFGYSGGPLLAVIGNVEAFTRDGQTLVRWETIESWGTAGFWLERKVGESWVRISSVLLPYPLLAPPTVVYEEIDPGAVPGFTYTYRLVELENQGAIHLYGPYELTVDGPDPIREVWDADHRDLGNGWRQLDEFGVYVPIGADGWIWHGQHGFFFVATGSTAQDLWLYAPDMGWLWTACTIYPFLYRAEDASWLWFNGSIDPRWFFNLTGTRWENWP